MSWIQFPELATSTWLWLLVGAALAGMEKSGIKGLSMLVVPILALQFGGKASTGLVLLLFMLADLFAIRYYRRDADWGLVWKLASTAVVGVVLGAWIGHLLSEEVFKIVLAVIIVSGLALLIWQEVRSIPQAIVNHPVTAALTGLLGGFSTMIANVASPVMAVYLLSVRLPKNSFIGTVVWFFFIINIVKLPFHVFMWGTVTWDSLPMVLAALPAIAVGFFGGLQIVQKIPEKSFRYFIMGVTFLAVVQLF